MGSRLIYLWKGCRKPSPSRKLTRQNKCLRPTPSWFNLSILSLLPGMFPLFATLLSITITGPSRPWSDRYLFLAFSASPQLSIRFNNLQRDSARGRLTVLKRFEHLSAVTFRTSLEGRSTRRGGRESHGVKRSVRVQAFTCPKCFN